MSIRHGENVVKDPVQQLRADIASVRSTEGQVTWESLTETEKSAGSMGVAADAWKPISFMNEAHYTELLKNNSLGSRLTQQIEAFKTVASSG